MQGRFRAHVVGYGVVRSKENRDAPPQYLIQFELSRTGQTVEWFGSLSAEVGQGKECSGLDVTMDTIRELGGRGDRVDRITFPDNTEALLTIIEETWQGRARNKVVNVAPPMLERLAVDASEAEDIGSRIGDVSRAGYRSKGSNGTGRSATQATSRANARRSDADAEDADEIPY